VLSFIVVLPWGAWSCLCALGYAASPPCTSQLCSDHAKTKGVAPAAHTGRSDEIRLYFRELRDGMSRLRSLARACGG